MYHKILLIISSWFVAGVANISLAADPRHIELFNTRNFCVLCTFNDAVLSPDTLYGRMHRNANISGTYVYRTFIDNLDLTFGFLYAVKGENFSIKNSEVKMMNITYSDLPYFTFINNQGSLVNFTGSGLDYGNFQHSVLDYPIFNGTSLVETNFIGAEFTHADFSGTWIEKTNFTDASLTESNFHKANISRANFTRANLLHSNITEEQLSNSIICDAILPDGLLGECHSKEGLAE